jgi:hypothetical protein
MVTQSGRIYMFREMYLRVSAYPYNLKSLQKFGHLNNVALQKFSFKYDNEQAIITPTVLEDYVRKIGFQKFSFEKQIRSKLRHIIAIVGKIFQKKFRVSHSIKKNFEIFGLDFMIDENLKVWFIEANSNPAITTGNSFLDLLIPRMLDDAFKLTLDKMFPIPKIESNFSKLYSKEYTQEVFEKYHNTCFPLQGYLNGENLWDKIKPEEIESALKTHIN